MKVIVNIGTPYRMRRLYARCTTCNSSSEPASDRTNIEKIQVIGIFSSLNHLTATSWTPNESIGIAFYDYMDTNNRHRR